MKKERRVIEPVAPAEPTAQQHDSKHHEAATDHDAKRKEWNRDGRALINRKILETLDLPVDLVSQDETPQERHVD